MKRKSLNPLSTKGLLSELQDPIIIDKCKTFIGPHLVNVAETLRERAKVDLKYRSQLSAVPRGKKLQRVTRYIYQEAINSVVRDGISLSNHNHWRDLFHMIVPIAYCDFVLLDKTWADRARKIMSRLRKDGQTAKMAQVFSGKDIDDFWEIFEE